MAKLELVITQLKDGGPYELKVSGDRRLRVVRPKRDDAVFLAQRCLDEWNEAVED